MMKLAIALVLAAAALGAKAQDVINPGTGGGGTPGGANTQVQFNNSGAFGGSPNMTWISPALSLGASGTTGQLKMLGGTSGFATLTSQATAGTPTLTLPNASGTFAVSATTPLSLDVNTGAITWTGATINTNPAVGDLLYGASSTSYSNLPDVATGSALISGGVGAAPSYGQIGLTTHVSGILPLANGGTNCAAPYPVLPKTATYQVLAADFTCFTTISVASGTFTITLVASGTQPVAGTWIKVINYGSGVVTIARSGQNINGGTTSLSLPAASATAPTAAFVTSDGTNYFANLAGAASGTLTGSGTTNSMAVWTGSSALGNSKLVDDGSGTIFLPINSSGNGARLQFSSTTNATDSTDFTWIGNTSISGGAYLQLVTIKGTSGGRGIVFSPHATDSWQVTGLGTTGGTGILAPVFDDTKELGRNALAPSAIFSATGVINTKMGGSFTGVLSNSSAYTAITAATKTYFAVGADGKIPVHAAVDDSTLNVGFNRAKARLECEFDGIYSTTNLSPTITFALDLCTVSGCGSGTVVTHASTGAITPSVAAVVTNQEFFITTKTNIFTRGGSGTADTGGSASFETGAIAFTQAGMRNNTGTSAIDTTVDQYVSPNVTWSATGNTITLRNFGCKVY